MAAPWFKIYPRQFLTDSKVKILSREHRSILMDLWCYCSEDGGIPADAETLARLLGEPLTTMRKALPCLLPFFVERDGRLVSERMEAESQAYEEKCQKLRESGSKGGLKKVANAKANASGESKQMLLQMGREVGSGKLEKALPPTPSPSASAASPKGESRKPKRTPWKERYDPEVVEATSEIMSIWPNSSQSQPKQGEHVPASKGPEVAIRLQEIKDQGGDLAVCVAIARRFVDEFKGGGMWAKAAENFFGRSDAAPWTGYYKAHKTNEAMESIAVGQ